MPWGSERSLGFGGDIVWKVLAGRQVKVREKSGSSGNEEASGNPSH